MVRRVIGWIAAILPSLAFLLAAAMKFSNNPQEVAAFALYGLPPWFMYLSGAMEVGGVALLLFTRWKLWGALLLCAVGLGATAEHLTHNQVAMAPIPFLCAALALLGAVLLSAPRPTAASA